SSPKAPFMTSTLQQEAGRKLRLSAQQVMRTAQGLYERGFITYMRTDSVVLADEALDAVRAQIGQDYGSDFVSSSVRRYASKVKNAQEAHEAIRPTLPLRSPDSVAGQLSGPDLALYRLVWQRTLASQMADAAGVTVSIRLGATAPSAGSEPAADCTFAASGTTITFPGHRKVYEESTDDDGESGDDKEALLPSLTVGDTVAVTDLVPGGHETTPPARYTEASIVKKLEELGIGRPSTWASIIQTVQDRGYVWKKGQALVPTWTAFAVVSLLERHFGELVDYTFTAGVEEELDEIAGKSLSKDVWLHAFYFGDAERGDLGELGLKRLIEQNIVDIDAAAINSFPIGADPTTGEVVNVKPGKYGPYVKRGDDTAGVPDNLAPDELTIDEALRLLSMPKSDEPIGEWEGHPVFAKNGRYGPYVQWGTIDEPPEGLAKPKMVSLFKTMALEHITMRDALDLLSLPRSIGTDPNDGVEILANNGRYGPYVQKDKDYRTIDNEERLLTITLDEAVQIFSQPKQFRRGRSVAAKGPLREFGTDPVSERPVVAKDGQYGVYVTDGEVNASLGKGDRIEDMLPERAYELLAIRREVMAEKGITPKKKKGAAKKAAPKKAAAKKSPAKKAAPKKAAAKKTS
ncbi:MAG: DNA topoisomerase, partial [Ilumatobacteraceae bacterium]